MSLTVASFGDTSANGTYADSGTFNGQTLYRKDATYFIAYHEELGPYSFAAGYYIFKKSQIEGSIPIYTPEYRVAGTDPTSSAWTSLMDQSSAQTTVGTVV